MPEPLGTTGQADLLDQVLGLKAGDFLSELRRRRPEFVDGAEICRHAVLSPAKDQGLPQGLRFALAARMARLNRDDALTAIYDQGLENIGPDGSQAKIAAGNTPETADILLAAILRHCDLITLDPGRSTKADIERLTAAGLTNPQIVALSELIAFVNFQTRITAGLRLLGEKG